MVATAGVVKDQQRNVQDATSCALCCSSHSCSCIHSDLEKGCFKKSAKEKVRVERDRVVSSSVCFFTSLTKTFKTFESLVVTQTP